MSRPKNNHHLYLGRAGHLASMAECLSRGWNVAIPEVDIGEDIFVVEDATSSLAKVQVKTATGKKIKNGFKAQYLIPKKQIEDTSSKGNDLRFILVSRYNKSWQPSVILTRKELLDLYTIQHIGTTTKKNELKLTMYYYFEARNLTKIKRIECGTQKGFSKKGFPKPELTIFMDKWDSFFKIRIFEGN
jgi:hypothetical protein